MRILGLDVGDKRIGVSICDPFGLFAQTLETIVINEDINPLNRICDLANIHKVEKIVIGLPKNMNGTIGAQGEKTLSFGNELKQAFSGEIIYCDERLTSKSANHFFAQAKTKLKERKNKIDMVAAVLILQSYLDSKNK